METPTVPTPAQRLETLMMERDGLLEGFCVLTEYVEEMYKYKDPDGELYGQYTVPPGLKMFIDKTKDKLKLVEDEINWLTRSKEEGEKPTGK
jgi:hypothetical protein